MIKMMCINVLFTLSATNQLPKIPTQRSVGVGIKTREVGFGGTHLAEAVSGKTGPGSQQCATAGGLRAETINPLLQDVAR